MSHHQGWNFEPEPREYTPADERRDVERVIGHIARNQRHDDTEENEDSNADIPDPADFDTEQEYLDELEDLGIDPGDADPWPAS